MTPSIGVPGACMLGRTVGPLLVVLEKLEPAWTSMASTLIGFRQSSRSNPSRMRMSVARALDGWAITLKKAIVLAKRSRSVCSMMNLVRMGFLNAAASVRRLPH